jgi:predicted MFS family arabinose efflux permease
MQSFEVSFTVASLAITIYAFGGFIAEGKLNTVFGDGRRNKSVNRDDNA